MTRQECEAREGCKHESMPSSSNYEHPAPVWTKTQNCFGCCFKRRRTPFPGENTNEHLQSTKEDSAGSWNESATSCYQETSFDELDTAGKENGSNSTGSNRSIDSTHGVGSSNSNDDKTRATAARRRKRPAELPIDVCDSIPNPRELKASQQQ